MPDPGQARYGRLGTTRRERDPAGHHRVLACGLPPSVVRRSLPQAAVSALRWAGAAAGTYGVVDESFCYGAVVGGTSYVG
jgi:hypothetical protein